MRRLATLPEASCDGLRPNLCRRIIALNAVPFDTLKLARDLEPAGWAAPVAAGTAVALADAMIGADLATKSDVGFAESRIMVTIRAVESSLKAKLELLRRDLTINLGGMIFVAVGIILTAMRFMPHP